MAGRTGYTAPTNSQAPQGPAQMLTIYQHFDSKIGETVSTASSLPSSGNWLGRQIMAEDTGALYLCTALSGTWTAIGGKPVPITVTVANSISWAACRVRRIGTRVFFDGQVSAGSDIPASTAAGTLPAGSRPAVDQVVPAMAMTSSFNPSVTAVNVTTAGVVNLGFVAIPAATRYVTLNFSFEIA